MKRFLTTAAIALSMTSKRQTTPSCSLVTTGALRIWHAAETEHANRHGAGRIVPAFGAFAPASAGPREDEESRCERKVWEDTGRR